jgi:Mg-chelatase subunit ChlD
VNKDISIVFCVDVSGSMAGLRIQAVQQTMRSQVKEMFENHPERKIGIVTFTDDVKIIGDGTSNTTTLDSGQIHSYETILKHAVVGASTSLTQPIKKARNQVELAISNLRATGSTALGPGMLAAIGLAGEGSPGSQVIVCTDGASNLGPNDPGFYSRVGEYAQSKGVTVHIVTFQGTECNIDLI